MEDTFESTRWLTARFPELDRSAHDLPKLGGRNVEPRTHLSTAELVFPVTQIPVSDAWRTEHQLEHCEANLEPPP